MMTRASIFTRLIGSRWLGPLAALLGFALGLAGSLLFSPGYPATRAFIDDALGWMSVMPVVYLPACLVAAALVTRTPAGVETVARLRQDGMPGVKVFGELTRRIRLRIRPVEVLMLWLPTGLFAGGIARQFFTPASTVQKPGGIFAMLLLTLGLWVTAAVLALGFRLVGMVLEEAGVWIGLRWPERRGWVVLGAALGVLAAAVGTIALGWLMGGDPREWSTFGCVVILVGWLALMAWLRLYLRAKAGRFIDGLAPVQAEE